MQKRWPVISWLLTISGLVLALQLVACGQSETPTDVNLLKNPSFEITTDGMPRDWAINNFRGLRDAKAASFGTAELVSHDGSRSFYFEADSLTRRFFMLSQEIRVKGVSRVRIRGAIKAEKVGNDPGQFAQANMAITLYDGNRNRFRTARFADFRTPPVLGTTDGWELQDRVYKIPSDTEYIVFHCVLGMSGTMWFDELSLEIPTDLPWQSEEGPVFAHHWLPGHEYPEGSREFQQELYDTYADRLEVPIAEREKIDYYYYADSTTFQEALGIKTKIVYSDFDNREIHSINPVDNHEIVHMITHPYGSLPLTLAEGTAFYLIDDFRGEQIHPLAQKLLRENRLPTLRQLLDSGVMRQLRDDQLVAGGASFVGYLIEYGGGQRFMELHQVADGIRTHPTFASAFEQVYGGKLDEAEQVWRATLDTADFSKWEKKSSPEGADTQEE